jgi:hypothetical protein
MPIQTEAEYQASLQSGYIGGDGLQEMPAFAQSRSHPDVLVKGQDMGGLWVSHDFGRSWWKPRCKGLLSHMMNGVQVDPVDPDHWVVMAQGSFLSVRENQGLYRTTDAGATFTKVFDYTGVEGRFRSNAIGYAPSSVSGGKAQRWYALINRATGTNNLEPGIYFARSTDAAASFSQVGSLLSLDTYGGIRGISVHPKDEDTFFFSSSTGLWKVTEAGGTSPKFSKVDVGMAGGFVNISYFAEVSGALHIIVGNGNGVRKSTNGGASWTSLSNKAVGNFYVSPWNADVMMSTGSSDRPVVSTDGGSSWTMPDSAAFEKRPGYNGEVDPSAHGNTHIAFHPTPGRAFLLGRVQSYLSSNAHYGTDDAGQSWFLSMDYFSGMQCQAGQSNGQGFSLDDKDVFAFGMVDVGPRVSTTRGRSYRAAKIDKAALGISRLSSSAFAIHPQYPTKPVVLAIMDGATGGKFGMTNRLDLDQWFRPSGVSNGSTRARFVGFDVSNPQYAYAIRSRSADHGETWAVMGSLPSGFEVWGMTRSAPLTDGQAIFAYDDLGNMQRVARSLDRGTTWNIVLDFGEPLLNMDGVRAGGAFLPHPSNHDRLFVKGPVSSARVCETVRLYRLDEGSGTNRPFTTIDLVPQNIRDQLAPGAKFYVNNFAVDPRYPDSIWYATNANPGTGVPLIRTTDGGATWTNLAGLVPDNNQSFTDVHPLTGDLIQSTVNGFFVIPPPYDEAETVYSGLLQPNRVLPDF